MENLHDLASRLTKRITLQEEVQTPDSGGGYSISWQDVASIWAEFVYLSGNRSDEPFISMQQEGRKVARVTIRYLPDVTPKLRIIYGLRVFNILSVINPGEEGELLELLVAEGVAV